MGFLKKIFCLSTGILILLLIICGCDTKNFVVIDDGNEEIKIEVEVADDDEEIMRGLMFKEFLDKKAGMLFIFEDEKERAFWMKNTLIPLDIIFISENLEIVDIEYAVPCREDPCENYVSKDKAKYVLEVNGNFTSKRGIKVGDKVKIQ